MFHLILFQPALFHSAIFSNVLFLTVLSAPDFVGQAVFLGSPKAPEGSEARLLYDQGVKFACWGMAMYSLSCSFYSFILDKLIKKFRAKPVYIGGQLVYCLGMICMAVTRLASGATRDSCTPPPGPSGACWSSPGRPASCTPPSSPCHVGKKPASCSQLLPSLSVADLLVAHYHETDAIQCEDSWFLR